MAESRNMLIVSRKPTHPGEVLREEFMPDYELSVAQLAKPAGRLAAVGERARALPSRRDLRYGAASVAAVRHIARVLVELAAQHRFVGVARPPSR